MMRLIQLSRGETRSVGLVEGGAIRLLERTESVYALANDALERGLSLAAAVEERRSDQTLDYDAIHEGRSDWTILPSVDHPEPSRCLVTGTGLTHRKSASSRQAMHADVEQVTDSMRMYQWGLEGGRPEAGRIGVAPEWFYKGDGAILRGHNQALEVPAHARDGGEEAEIAGVYLIDRDGVPRRIGMTAGNEFSDHVFERKNYLYLAASKLRTCAIGPELVLDPDFTSVEGSASILRGGKTVWSKPIHTGEAAMCHSLANIEHHHFKFDQHRRPGDVHVHFFGADAFSFGDGVQLEEGDVMEIAFTNFGRALRNPVRIARSAETLVEARPL